MEYSKANIEKIREMIETRKENLSVNADSFILYQILMTLYEVEDPVVRDVLLQPEYPYEKMQSLRIAYQEGIPLTEIKKLSALEMDAIKVEKEQLLREKFQEEIKEKLPDPADHALLLKTVESTIAQVHGQLRENQRITQFLMDSLTELKTEHEDLKKERKKERQKNSTDPPGQEEAAPKKIKMDPVEKPQQKVELKLGTVTQVPDIEKKPDPNLKSGFFRKWKRKGKAKEEERGEKQEGDALLDLMGDLSAEQIQLATDAYQSGLAVSDIKRFAVKDYPIDKMEQIKNTLMKMRGIQTGKTHSEVRFLEDMEEMEGYGLQDTGRDPMLQEMEDFPPNV